MGAKELERLKVIEQVRAKQISKTEAAKRIGVSRPHFHEVYKAFCARGPGALVSSKRGKPSNNRIPDEVRQAIVGVIREKYLGFKPTFAQQKLTEVHGFSISKESVRQIMMNEGLWRGKRSKAIRVHQMRMRRGARGELIQMDGSPHNWFEGRRDRCCLLVCIDDATSELLGLHFVETECLAGYFDLMRNYLSREGRPCAIYTDRHSLFHLHIKEAETGTGETQFGRAMRQLDIELIPANSPQAKGRVERANKTLQDRLIKEMRLLGISSIAEANKYLPEFIKDHNRRYAVAPLNPIDAHRKTLPKELDLILSLQEQRILSKNLELSYKNVIYQVQIKMPGYQMRGAAITVCESHGKVTLLYKGKALPFKSFDKHNQPKEAVSSKDLNTYIDKRVFSKPPKPKPNHPWRTPGKPGFTQNSHLSTVLPKQPNSSLSSASESYG